MRNDRAISWTVGRVKPWARVSVRLMFSRSFTALFVQAARTPIRRGPLAPFRDDRGNLRALPRATMGSHLINSPYCALEP